MLLPGTVFGPTLEVSLTQVVHRGVARAFLTGRIQGPQGPEWVNLWSNRNRHGTLAPTPYAYQTNDPVTDPGLQAEWRELPRNEADEDGSDAAGPGGADAPHEVPEAGHAGSSNIDTGDYRADSVEERAAAYLEGNTTGMGDASSSNLATGCDRAAW